MIILDLFCCAGGAGAGYDRAGFNVYGIDLDRQPRYPFAFRQMDALQALRDLLDGEAIRFGDALLSLDDIDAIHASPPCQGYTRGNAGRVTKWPKLIPDVRALLEQTGKPYVIENVKDAGPEMRNPHVLCGCMFDLKTVDTDGITIHLQRIRLFETNFPLPELEHDHSEHEWVAGAYGGARRDKYEAKYVRKGGYVPKEKVVVAALLGIEHDMTWSNLFESIPPAYTEHIGRVLQVTS